MKRSGWPTGESFSIVQLVAHQILTSAHAHTKPMPKTGASERAASLDQGQPGLARGDLYTFDAGGHICSVGSDTAGNPEAIRAGELGRDRLLRCCLYDHQVKPYIMRKSSACCCTVEECLLQLYLRDTVLRAACMHGSSTKSSFPTTRPHLVPHPPVV